ncbi:MAG: ATPase P [Deltaproteobacteria bacterium]|nr:ATPase P [Deltaproteobacteria bacterium]
MALRVAIPGRGELALAHLVLDLNGTMALDGSLVPGVREAVDRLAGQLTCHLVTADTFGTAAGLFGGGVELCPLSPGEEDRQKEALVRSLGAAGVAAVGNGANDALMLGAAALGIAVLGPEGLAVEALLAAQVVAPGPLAALELLLKPDRLRATLRR